MQHTITTPRLKRAIPRILVRVALIVILVVCVQSLYGWVQNYIDTLHHIGARPAMITGVIVIALLGYAILLAIPFMPGIEVGIALLLLQGQWIAPFVYIATIIGLFTAYLIGRLIPLVWLHNAFRDLHMLRACELIQTIQSKPAEERLNGLQHRLPDWLARLTVNYRYVTLGLLVNLPGTFAIGGGGGILMLAGIVRLFSNTGILLMLVIATLPIPLLVWLGGTEFLR